MIKFSALLVALAIGLLAAGVAASSLLLVYVAIGVCLVSAVLLAVGVIRHWAEIFGSESRVPAAGTVPGTALLRAATGTAGDAPAEVATGDMVPGMAETGAAAAGAAAPGGAGQPEPAPAMATAQAAAGGRPGRWHHCPRAGHPGRTGHAGRTGRAGTTAVRDARTGVPDARKSGGRGARTRAVARARARRGQPPPSLPSRRPPVRAAPPHQTTCGIGSPRNSSQRASGIRPTWPGRPRSSRFPLSPPPRPRPPGRGIREGRPAPDGRTGRNGLLASAIPPSHPGPRVRRGPRSRPGPGSRPGRAFPPRPPSLPGPRLPPGGSCPPVRPLPGPRSPLRHPPPRRRPSVPDVQIRHERRSGATRGRLPGRLNPPGPPSPPVPGCPVGGPPVPVLLRRNRAGPLPAGICGSRPRTGARVSLPRR